MTVSFETWASWVKDFDAALAELIPLAKKIGVPAPSESTRANEREWFELLEHKLRPQLLAPPYLIVAIVGGTNIGKSLIFNHLAREDASAVSPLAAGTKHPVCLVPTGFDDEKTLERLFEGFELQPWHSSHDPLTDNERDLMFWRIGRTVPERLFLLDTPDIDSDHPVNWERAAAIRRAADVLIAVLTQQKYNDAAVKQFFRKVAEADKPVIVVFNQCELTEDREVWPHWLNTFIKETGAAPELVYVVPRDRAAANELRLPFYEVGPLATAWDSSPQSLRDDLARLRFDAIKLRTLRGAIGKILDPATGAAAYLHAIRRAGREFEAALAALSTADMARVDWPTLPAQMLVDEIRDWWDTHRSGWARQIHGVYRSIGRGVTWPVRTVWGALHPPAADPWQDFHRRERHVIVQAIEKLIEELKRLSQIGNETLRPRLAAMLKGEARAQLLADVEASHAQLPPIDEHYREFLRGELDRWGQENPGAIAFLRSIDHVLAVARPAITVSLAVSGWVLAGGLVHGLTLHAASHGATELAAEAAVAGGVTGGGEALVDATSSRVRLAAARLLRQLQIRYAEQRAEWLSGWLEQRLFADLFADLKFGAELSHSAAFARAESIFDKLRHADWTARQA